MRAAITIPDNVTNHCDKKYPFLSFYVFKLRVMLDLFIVAIKTRFQCFLFGSMKLRQIFCGMILIVISFMVCWCLAIVRRFLNVLVLDEMGGPY